MTAALGGRVAAQGEAEWDAPAYDRVADAQEEWGREVLGRLELRGDETVLDAGCGSGRVTRHLLERLPRGRVIGVDASTSMIEFARGALDPRRTELLVADLAELRLDEPVDAVFSNAVFHWISDHDRLFCGLRDCMRAGAPLEAQCGGEGNVAELQGAVKRASGDARFAPHLGDRSSAWNFAGVAETEDRLRAAGFTRVRAWLESKRVVPGEPRDYLRAVSLNWHLRRLPEPLHDDFVEAVLSSTSSPLSLDYVRLNLSAARP